MRRGLHPVTSMIRTAERIADGDLHERAQIVHPADEVGHLGQALNTMLDRLTEAIDAKTASEALMRRFAADASHELRTPLTSIRGYAELYRKGGGDLGRETAIQRIEHEATRMGSLVDDLLLLARLDQGRPLAREPVDVNTIVADAVDAARVRTSAPIDLDLPAHPATASGDGPRLRQVIDNVIANVATHAVPDANAHVSVTHNEGRITVVISDDGVGMSPDVLDHALDRFRQADPDHADPGGTGLGLAITNEIVRAHGGALSLASEPGKGPPIRASCGASASAYSLCCREYDMHQSLLRLLVCTNSRARLGAPHSVIRRPRSPAERRSIHLASNHAVASAAAALPARWNRRSVPSRQLRNDGRLDGGSAAVSTPAAANHSTPAAVRVMRPSSRTSARRAQSSSKICTPSSPARWS